MFKFRLETLQWKWFIKNGENFKEKQSSMKERNNWKSMSFGGRESSYYGEKKILYHGFFGQQKRWYYGFQGVKEDLFSAKEVDRKIIFT